MSNDYAKNKKAQVAAKKKLSSGEKLTAKEKKLLNIQPKKKDKKDK